MPVPKPLTTPLCGLLGEGRIHPPVYVHNVHSCLMLSQSTQSSHLIIPSCQRELLWMRKAPARPRFLCVSLVPFRPLVVIPGIEGFLLWGWKGVKQILQGKSIFISVYIPLQEPGAHLDLKFGEMQTLIPSHCGILGLSLPLSGFRILIYKNGPKEIGPYQPWYSRIMSEVH